MKLHYGSRALLLGALACLPSVASAAGVITFDDMPVPFGTLTGPTYSEAGFDLAFSDKGFIRIGGNGGTPSIVTGYFNTTQTARLTITGARNFQFDGLGYSGWGSGGLEIEVSRLTFTGSLNGIQVFSYRNVLPEHTRRSENNYTDLFVAGRAGNIDRLDIDTSGMRLELDNIAFSDAAVTAVPEPAAWAMMALGFGVAGTVARRRPRGAIA